MSLLMDALKKAEREREAQASKEQGDDAESSQELSLDPMETPPAPAREEVAPVDPGDSGSWDLEEAAELDEPLDLDFDTGALSLDLGDEPTSTPASTPAALRDIPFSAELDDVPLEDTSSTIPSMKAVRASVDRYFDGSVSESMSMETPLDQDDATTVVKTREALEAQAAAQTVFEAKRRRRGAGWVWIPVGLLLFVLLIGAGVFYWFSLGGTQGSGVGDLVATVTGTGVQPPVPSTNSQTATNTGATPQTGADGVLDQGAGQTSEVASAANTITSEDGLNTLTEPALSEVMEVEPPAVGDLSPVEPLPEVDTEFEPEPIEAAEPPSSEALLASADEQISMALGNDGAGSGGSLSGGGLQLSRNAPKPRVNPNVQNGYEAYQRGDFASAELSYREALRSDPTSRDAMLGLAAIAVTKGRIGVAAEIYNEILRIEPRDSVAHSALMSLQINPTTDTESRLKLMLQREPNASHLHFALGNYYAAQSEWNKAQNAYFNAFRLDPGNADYAYNLAVGLDHLAQPQAAVEYYRRALELAEGEPVGFQTPAVLARIESITQ